MDARYSLICCPPESALILVIPVSPTSPNLPKCDLASSGETPNRDERYSTPVLLACLPRAAI